MNILSLENISKTYTGRVLFEEISFFMQEGDKVGIVGVNGTGKSTLLRIAAGLEEPDEGKRTTASNLKIRFLEQMPEMPAELSVFAYAMAEAGRDAVYDVEGEVRAMLERMGITDTEQKVGELSGGQKKRLALAAVLCGDCDVLILDEPTNHLDLWMADWLEDFLKKWRKSLIMVTHDRYFLDSVVNRIVEIDHGQLYNYDCNYEGYLARKTEREEQAIAGEHKRQNILRIELAWVRRGARARSTKQKAHLQRYEDLKNQKGPEITRQVEMSSVSTRMGNTTIELERLSKAFGGRTLISDFSYIFLKNDRVGFIGPNGCGKTTLMKMLTGGLEPDAGTIRIGQTIRIGYYSQEIAFDKEQAAGKDQAAAYMDPEQKVIDYIRDTAEYVRTEDGLVSASSMLDRFLFPPSEQYSKIGKLSGGERRRLNLLRVLMEAPNVLILDEPTNDLDITTLAILEDYLDRFSGIVITVSHDRYFLDRVVNRIFAFEEGGRLTQYEGGYTEYAQKAQHSGVYGGDASGFAEKTAGTARKKEDAAGPASAEAFGDIAAAASGRAAYEAAKANRPKKLKFSFAEQREYDTIEEDIAALEERIAECDRQMLANARDFVKLRGLTEEKEAAEAALEEKMERWEYLEDLAEQIRSQNEES